VPVQSAPLPKWNGRIPQGKQLVKLRLWGYSGSGGNISWNDSVRVCRK
jgi:hypothetical protein